MEGEKLPPPALGKALRAHLVDHVTATGPCPEKRSIADECLPDAAAILESIEKDWGESWRADVKQALINADEQIISALLGRAAGLKLPERAKIDLTIDLHRNRIRRLKAGGKWYEIDGFQTGSTDLASSTNAGVESFEYAGSSPRPMTFVTNVDVHGKANARLIPNRAVVEQRKPEPDHAERSRATKIARQPTS